MRIIDFIRRAINPLVAGRFDIFFCLATRKLPPWLVIYNKALVLQTEKLILPDKRQESIKVKIATHDDINDIIRISSWSREDAGRLIDSGIKFFLASIDGNPPAAITGLAYGHCYIRGMGFEFDMAPEEVYGVGTMVLTEYRRKGLYLGLTHAVSDYLRENGIKYYNVLVEVTNDRNLALRNKMGFKEIFTVTFIKLAFLKINYVKGLKDKKKSFRFFVRIPQNNITIV
nr:GNAT family N-acetyltransferase [candidate division Zixibacteria bacterium]